MVCPWKTIGTPPWSGVKSSSAVIVKRPWFTMFSNSRVGLRNMAAVRALPVETRGAAANAPSLRTTVTRFPPSSTARDAGPAPSRAASASIAAVTLRAPARSSVYLPGTWAYAGAVADASARAQRVRPNGVMDSSFAAVELPLTRFVTARNAFEARPTLHRADSTGGVHADLCDRPRRRRGHAPGGTQDHARGRARAQTVLFARGWADLAAPDSGPRGRARAARSDRGGGR